MLDCFFADIIGGMCAVFRDSKAKRQMQKLQHRKKKMEEMWLQKRLGTSHGPPKIVAIVPLSHDVNVDNMLRSILREASSSNAGPEGSPLPAVVSAAFMNGKTKLTFLRTEMDILPALDVARIADVVLFAVAARSGIADIVDVVSRCTYNQFPSIATYPMYC
jgi:hypothetical protein